jgi:NADH-quinone oxidoreductase subunit E
MSMFSFPADMNKNEMMKPMTAMTDWTKAADLQVAPMMVYPLGAAAVATAVGFGMAGQMTGLMMGAMQAAMRSQGSVMGSKPDLSWMVPTLAEDLAPEEFDESPAAEASNPDANAKSADIVALKPAAKTAAKAAVAAPDAEAKAKPTARKPATVKTAAAKAKASNTKPTAAKGTATAPETEKTDPSPVEALSGDGAVAVVEKLKSDANVAAAAASEAGAADKAADAEPAKVIEPEDFRRPTEIEKPETPDDLKRISGVGPKLEQVLNGLGVWTFAQISDWKAEEIAWVDDYLQFKGRIDRDDWVSQARKLAKGGKAA